MIKHNFKFLFCTFVKKYRTMVYELKKEDDLADLLETIKRKNGQQAGKTKKKTLADIYGCLIRGLDGLEYQKTARNGEGD
jgi:hypothetical protein